MRSCDVGARFGDDRLPGRFWDKVSVAGSGCWEWTASTRNGGYGQFWLSPRLRSSHRVAYEALVGPIPPGLQIDHLCRNRGCCNPDHLELVTQSENARRGIPGQRSVQCKNGHPWSEGNTYTCPRGKRHCRTCRRAYNTAWKRRARAS